MLKLSACVIVKNEEKNIPTWLTCMKKIANEMIVVDTGSSDATVKLAKDAGAQVYDYKWNNDFSAAKNFALDQANGNWILFLDADEYFPEKMVDNVISGITQVDSNQNIDGLICPLINIDVDKGNSFISEIQSLRIFRHQPTLRFQGNVHEFLTRTNGPLRIAKITGDVEIYHTGYSSSIIRQKLERNLSLLQEDIRINGEKPVHYPYLADCYYGLKNYEKAIEYAKRSIAENVVAVGQESTIYRRLIDSLALSGRQPTEILPVVESAIDKFPLMPEFVWNKGELFFQEKKYVDAERVLKKSLLLAQEQQEKIAGEVTFKGQLNLVYCRLGEISVLKNDISQALEFFVKSLQCYRYNTLVLQKLYQQLHNQDPVEVIALFKTLYNDSKRDMLFLVQALQEWANSKVYIYYAQKLNMKYHVGQEDVSAKALLAAEKYGKAIDYTAKKLQENYIFMIIAIVCQYDENKYKTAQCFLPETYCRILNKCMGSEVILNQDEQQIYDEIKDKIRVTGNKLAVLLNDSKLKTDNRLEVKEAFKVLLKALQKKSSAANEAKLVALFKTAEMSVVTAYELIQADWGPEDTIGACILLSAVLFKNEMEKLALQLMLYCYKENHNKEEITYAFAYMLQLYGDNIGAQKVIKAANSMTPRLVELLELCKESAGDGYN